MELDDDDTEESLVRQAHETLKDEELDVIEKIKTKTWKLGAIIALAQKKGYTRIKGGLKAWVKAKHLGSHTHAYDCLNAWNTRHQFDDALKYYRERNDDWSPKKATGPRFQLELVKALNNRGKPEKPRKAHGLGKLEREYREEQLLKHVAELESELAGQARYVEILQYDITTLENRLNSTNRPTFKRALKCLETVATHTDDESGHTVCALCDNEIPAGTSFEDHYKVEHLPEEVDRRFEYLWDDLKDQADRNDNGKNYCQLCEAQYEGSWHDHYFDVHNEPDIVEPNDTAE